MTLASQRRWREKNKEWTAQFEARNKPKRLARAMARRHIEIPFGTKCVNCKERFATDRHHADHSKPLDVLLVCRTCNINLG